MIAERPQDDTVSSELDDFAHNIAVVQECGHCRLSVGCIIYMNGAIRKKDFNFLDVSMRECHTGLFCMTTPI